MLHGNPPPPSISSSPENKGGQRGKARTREKRKKGEEPTLNERTKLENTRNGECLPFPPPSTMSLAGETQKRRETKTWEEEEQRSTVREGEREDWGGGVAAKKEEGRRR